MSNCTILRVVPFVLYKYKFNQPLYDLIYSKLP